MEDISELQVQMLSQTHVHNVDARALETKQVVPLNLSMKSDESGRPPCPGTMDESGQSG